MMTLNHITQLETLECCKCGMPFALSAQWIKSARALGNFKQQFHCPYCDEQQGWGTSLQEKKLNELSAKIASLETEKTRLAERESAALAEAEHFRKSRDGMKGALQKVKIRVSKGVCPCCKRTFENLARHMESKHKSFTVVNPAGN